MHINKGSTEVATGYFLTYKRLLTYKNKNVMKEIKYSSCAKCIETALEIELGQTKKSWNDLGNGHPFCGTCIQELRKQFFPPDKEK